MKNVCSSTSSSCAAGQLEALRAERAEQQGDVLVEVGVESEHRPTAGRAVVTHHGLAVPEAPHEPGDVFQLGSGDAEAVGVEHAVHAAPEPEDEPPAGHAVHRGGVAGRDDRMAGVVVGDTGRDAHPLGHGPGGAAQRADLLDVEPFAEEHGAEAERLAVAALLEQVGRRLRCAGEPVEAELVERAGGG
ncbi:MAG: hypothetical protein R2713_07735 [Ilumatobacteraceae bacterium]